MKIPGNTFSFAHVAHEINFPGGALNFVFWLRKFKYLSADLQPHSACLELGLFVNHTQKLPGLSPTQFEIVNLPRITRKGLNYFVDKFEHKDFTDLDLTLSMELSL